MKEFLDILELICCDDPKIQTRSSSLILFYSFRQPEVILNHLKELYIIISGFCASDEPEWGLISYICFSIANAIALFPNSETNNIFNPILNISLEVTKIYFSVKPTYENYKPFLSTLAQILIELKKLQITETIFLSLNEHCIVGFLKHSSLVPVLIKNFEDIVSLIEKMSPIHYEKLIEPISNEDIDVSTFYFALWVNLMRSLDNHPLYVNYLKAQSFKFLSLSKKDGLLQEASKFLLYCINNKIYDTDNKDINYISDSANRISEYLLSSLIESFSKKEIKIKKRRTSQNVGLLSSSVKILQNKLMKKMYISGYSLVFIADASLICWATDSDDAEEGYSLSVNEIKNVEIYTDKEINPPENNVMCITNSSNDKFIFSFDSPQVASQWLDILQQ